MTALIFPVVPAMDSDYWQVKQLPELVLNQCGGRVYVDHVSRVLRARLVLDLSVSTPTGRAAGGER